MGSSISTNIELLIDLLHAIEDFQESLNQMHNRLAIVFMELDEQVAASMKIRLPDLLESENESKIYLSESQNRRFIYEEMGEIELLVKRYQKEKEELLCEFRELTLNSPTSIALVTRSITKLSEYLDVDLSVNLRTEGISAGSKYINGNRSIESFSYADKNQLLMKTKNLTTIDRETIHEMIRSGTIGEEDIREVGKPARKIYYNHLNNIINGLNESRKARLVLVDEYSRVNDEATKSLILTKLRSLREQENEINEKLKPEETMKSVINQYRSIGPSFQDDGQKYIDSKEKSTNMVVKAINEVRQFLPTEWINRSNNHAIEAISVERGYYVSKDDGTSVVALSSGRGILRCAFHEIGHHFESLYPEIRILEHEFYSRRTKGEELQWLGIGYSQQEKTRYDRFVNSYIGKDYGDSPESAYEILSMGLEALYTASFSLMQDMEYQDFLFGILILI